MLSTSRFQCRTYARGSLRFGQSSLNGQVAVKVCLSSTCTFLLRDHSIWCAAMSDIDTAEYGIVVNQELQYSIWPTHLGLPSGYKFAGTVGTQAEMQELLSQQFVETAPSTYVRDVRFGDSRWVDAR